MKRLALIPTVFMVVSLLSQACFAQIATDLDRIRNQNELIVAVLAKDIRPFVFSGDNGEISGLDVDMAREIGRQLGVAVRFLRTAQTLDEVVNQVSRGEADIGVSNVTITLRRARQVYFTRPYLELPVALLVNRQTHLETPNIPGSNVPDFSGALGVIKGTSYVDLSKEVFPKATLKQFDTIAEENTALAQGEIQAELSNALALRRLVASRPDLTVHNTFIELKDFHDRVGIAVRPDSPFLVNWLNLFLAVRARKGPTTVEQLLDLDHDRGSPMR